MNSDFPDVLVGYSMKPDFKVITFSLVFVVLRRSLLVEVMRGERGLCLHRFQA
jgi:hypothetical protein